MMYNDIFAVEEFLMKHLESFNGKQIGFPATRKWFVFDTIARATCFLAKEKSAESVAFEGTAMLGGKVYPVNIEIAGDDMYKPMRCTLSIKK